MDQAIERVETVDGGIRVIVRDLGEIPMPVHLVATTSTGEEIRSTSPVDQWRGTRVLRAELTVRSPVVRVEIDPDRAYPDLDRDNNVWVASQGR